MNTRACAHRGDKDCAPENTVPAFAMAVEKGAAQIEFDITESSDGQLLIMHDATVDRCTNGRGALNGMTFADLRSLDAGSWYHLRYRGTRIPTLEEALEAIPPHVLCNIHLQRVHTAAAKTARMVADMSRLAQCFLACNVEEAAAARAVAPDIQICNMSNQGGPASPYPAETIEQGCEYIQLYGERGELAPYRAVVEHLHAHHVTVNHCCASDEEGIRFLMEAGVDYILTDKLDLCQQILAMG